MNAPDPVRLARQQRAAAAWRTNLRWTAVLLALWFAGTFGVSWFARELRFDFFGWPFSFWAGAQGLLILYVLMAAAYAWRMNRADREIGEPADEPRDQSRDQSGYEPSNDAGHADDGDAARHR